MNFIQAAPLCGIVGRAFVEGRMADIGEYLKFLKPGMLVDLPAIDLAPFINQYGQVEVTKIPNWEELVSQEHLQDTERLLREVEGGGDSIDLAKLTADVWFRMKTQARCDLTWLLAEVFRAPFALGAALNNSWSDGHHGSILQSYTPEELETWFRLAAPETLMTGEERAALADLPDPTPAYRGATSRKGLSWTLDRSVAESIVERLGKGKVFAADIPRSRVLAYFDDRQEAELIVSLAKAH